MYGTQRSRIVIGSAGLVALLAVTATACGSDDDAADAPTTEEFCLEAQALEDGGDDSGPFSEFYEKHPEPTPEDWAADGYLVTDALQQAIDDIEALHPSEEAQPAVDELVGALEAERDQAETFNEVAGTGDQAEMDRLEQVNQDTVVPAIMAAMEAVTDVCAALPQS